MNYKEAKSVLAMIAGGDDRNRQPMLHEDVKTPEAQLLYTAVALSRGSRWWMRPCVTLSSWQTNVLVGMREGNRQNIQDLLRLIVRASGRITITQEQFQNLLRWYETADATDMRWLLNFTTTKPTAIGQQLHRKGEVNCPDFLRLLLLDVARNAPETQHTVADDEAIL